MDTLALKLLPEVLERQCRYKLFIFGRDEFPGQGAFSVRYLTAMVKGKGAPLCLPVTYKWWHSAHLALRILGRL